MGFQKIIRDYILKNLYYIFIIELFIGGGGRLIPIGPVSARMIIFFICILIYGIFYFSKRYQPGIKMALILIAFFFTSHLHAIYIGLLSGNDVQIIITELQQAFFLICAPFIAFILRDINMVKKTASVLKLSAIFLSLSYIIVLALLFIGYLNPISFYEAVSPSGEFFFRTDILFFYKGFIYIALGIIFFVALQERRWQLWALLLTVALLITLTKGFWISTSIAAIILLLQQRRLTLAFLIITLIVLAIILIIGIFPSLDGLFESNQIHSTNKRVEDMKYIYDNITLFTFLFGEGYGSSINNRINIENTYLWVLWKIGVLGIFFWFTPLIISTYYFYKISKIKIPKIASAYYSGVILIYIQTATNPYLNNPIGLSFVIISIFSLRTIYYSLRDPHTDYNKYFNF